MFVFELVLMMAYLALFEYLAVHTQCIFRERHMFAESNERLYMDMIWACFMQIINLRLVAAHLQYSKIN